MKKYTGKDLLEAIKKNKIPWGKDTFFIGRSRNETTGETHVEAACALGIGAINLGINPEFFTDAIYYKTDQKFQDALLEIVNYNDKIAQTWEDIVKRVEEILTPFSDTVLYSSRANYEIKDHEVV